MRPLRRFINIFRNKVYIVDGEKVRRKWLPFFKGLKIIFDRENNTLYIDKNAKFKNTKIELSCNKAEIRLGSGIYRRMEILSLCGNNQKLIIGNNFSSIQAVIYLVESNSHIEIGNNNMFSKDIVIYATDAHAIYNLGENRALNTPKPIKIGNHVWIGYGVKLRKELKLGIIQLSDLAQFFPGIFLKKKTLYLQVIPQE